MENEQRYPYRYEMHCHTSWCSGCGRSTPQEMAEAYYNAGFAGMVVTDHFLRGNSCVDRSLPWDEMMRCYYDAYLAAKQWADKQERPFHVLFGIENAYGDGKEVLTYGIDLDFLLAHPDLHLYSLPDYEKAVHEAGGLVIMAHPYRRRGYIRDDVLPQPQYLDGAEIYNFYNAPEENPPAQALAIENGLLQTSGGDEHSAEGAAVGQTGIALKAPATTNEELVAALKSRDYRLVIGGETVPWDGMK